MPKPNEKPNEKPKPLTPFDLALAAKQGKLEVKALRGASKLLYNQLDEKQLEAYTRKPKPYAGKSFGRQPMRRATRSV